MAKHYDPDHTQGFSSCWIPSRSSPTHLSCPDALLGWLQGEDRTYAAPPMLLATQAVRRKGDPPSHQSCRFDTRLQQNFIVVGRLVIRRDRASATVQSP